MPTPSTPRPDATLMYSEAAESAEAVRRQLSQNADIAARLGADLRARKPHAVITVGRGSSDHAGVYARYLIETRLGTITSPAGLSVASLYRAPLQVEGMACLAISQSGQSPDLIAAVETLRNRGAYTIALVNAEGSPLADTADETLPLHAGPENSVAATKSYIAALAALAQLSAEWAEDDELKDALTRLPDQLEAAWSLNWSAPLAEWTSAQNLFVLGRGISYSITREAALKFKETCSLHAESYSAAEVLHGPAALIGDGFPILGFAQRDATQDGTLETLRTLAGRGAKVYAAGVEDPSFTALPSPEAHPLLQPMLMVQSFYKLVNALSVARGCDPDRPPHLSKVTQTR